jgi:homoserine kinase
MAKQKRNPKKLRELTITLPATSANLGPAFDAAALALSMFLRVHAKPAKEFSIAARGLDAEVCGQMKDHLILETYRDVFEGAGKRIVPLSLSLQNEIPIGKGCGSSAAARLAGIVLANHYGRMGWNDDRIMAEAAQREGHLDNAAACWLGGLAVGRISKQGEVHVVRILPKGKWPLLLAVPEEMLPTEEARGILPRLYSRLDAVTNVQNSMLLAAAFMQGRKELLAVALEDRIHQPYRAQLCPLLPGLEQLSGKQGILGVALSGAGPSVLVFVDPKTSFQHVKRRVRARLKAIGLRATLMATAITPCGATQSLR